MSIASSLVLQGSLVGCREASLVAGRARLVGSITAEPRLVGFTRADAASTALSGASIWYLPIFSPRTA